MSTDNFSFRQVLLPPLKLEHGLSAFSSEEVPDVPVSMIASEPSDLEQKGIHFAQSFDDLDYVQVAVVQLDAGPRLALIRHQGNPVPGTEICAVDAGPSSHKAASTLTDILGVRRADVLWTATSPA